MNIKLLSLIVLLSALFTACGNEKKEPVQQQVVTETKPAYDSVLTMNFYKRMEGTIADQPVVVQLQCYNGKIQGMYYYLNHGVWIMLTGTVNPANPNNVTIEESNFSDGEKTAMLDCKYDQGTLKGSWRSADGKKNYLIDLKESYPEGSYTFTTMSLRDSLAAFQQVDSSPVANVSKAFVIPLKDDEESKWLGLQIKKAIGIDSQLLTLDIQTGATKMNGKFLKGYRDEVKNMGEDRFASFLNYEDVLNISICYNENGYVILNTDVYAYTGGAHGNGGSSFNCLDVTNRKALKLKDILKADSARLQPIVEAEFRKQQGLKPTDSLTTILFENHLATTDNFYFTNKGIGFYYFPYEVAAYAVGPIHVFVPFSSLKNYLTPDFVQRMKLQ
jgi:hypothetical protein